jgi:hypothetical protein
MKVEVIWSLKISDGKSHSKIVLQVIFCDVINEIVFLSEDSMWFWSVDIFEKSNTIFVKYFAASVIFIQIV